MKTRWGICVLTSILTVIGPEICDLWGQESPIQPHVLHIEQSTTTSRPKFPPFLTMYHVLGGASSPAEAQSLIGTISLKNFDPTFSEELFALVYWQGECPAHDITLSEATAIIWTDIVKNPTQGNSTLPVNLEFPHPLPMTGCVGLYYNGGALAKGKVTISADLDLTYRSLENPSPNMVTGVGGEYCFGQDGGCQNATAIDGEAFAVPIKMTVGGHLLELYGNISDSTFDGTNSNGPLPTASWGAVNDFYLLPGGCGIFDENLNSQGFPNPAPLSTLHSWLPKDALHLASLPLVDRVSPGESSKAALQGQVENIFSVPVKVNSGDCILVIYGRTGNGATDNETQVNALMGP